VNNNCTSSGNSSKYLMVDILLTLHYQHCQPASSLRNISISTPCHFVFRCVICFWKNSMHKSSIWTTPTYCANFLCELQWNICYHAVHSIWFNIKMVYSKPTCCTYDRDGRLMLENLFMFGFEHCSLNNTAFSIYNIVY
jgi:hypothetical protein